MNIIKLNVNISDIKLHKEQLKDQNIVKTIEVEDKYLVFQPKKVMRLIIDHQVSYSGAAESDVNAILEAVHRF